MTQQIDNSKHGPRLDDQLAQHAREEADVRDWDTPGHDGIVGAEETDPDRRDLRALIGQHISSTHFPATTKDLIATAAANDAPPEVLEELRTLDPSARFTNAPELWSALDLGIDQRF
jgi:hypothetical protein